MVYWRSESNRPKGPLASERLIWLEEAAARNGTQRLLTMGLTEADTGAGPAA
jgi:hypothetical protein